LAVEGKQAEHLCAYARITVTRTVITIAPRFFAELTGDTTMLPIGEKIWGNTAVLLPFHLQGTHYICAYTGKVLEPKLHLSAWSLPVAVMLAEFPVGLIIGETV
jgi:(1->4)-alpha-D-glucan 1-alpha-D-glucosylmutase